MHDFQRLPIVRALIAAFEFPPLASPGVRRPLGFVRHLPEFGVQPIVITTDYKSYVDGGFKPFDPGLEKWIPQGTPVIRVPCKTITRFKSPLLEWCRLYFSITEHHKKAWYTNVRSILPEIVEKHRPDIILATVPPFFMAPLWCSLSKEFGVPVLLDFRDAWSQWCNVPNGSWFHYQLKKRLEYSCLVSAIHVITTSGAIKADLHRVHSSISDSKISVITNGYDIDLRVPRASHSTRPYKIGYVGQFYFTPQSHYSVTSPWYKRRLHRILNYVPRKENWVYRTPYFFFRSLATLLAFRPDIRNRVRVELACEPASWLQLQIDSLNLQDVVKIIGRMNHEGIIKFQQSCNSLLLTSAKVLNGHDYSIAGKTFEYFALQRPIVAFVAEGAQKDILEPSGLAVFCDPDDHIASARTLERLIEGHIIQKPDAEYLNRFSRRSTVSVLARRIRQALSNRAPAS